MHWDDPEGGDGVGGGRGVQDEGKKICLSKSIQLYSMKSEFNLCDSKRILGLPWWLRG